MVGCWEIKENLSLKVITWL